MCLAKQFFDSMAGRFLVAVAVSLSCAPAAFAGFSTSGSSPAFSYSDASEFNFLAIKWESGSYFSGNGFSSLGPDWTTIGSSDLANATFVPPLDLGTTLANFDVLFQAPPADGTTFLFFAFEYEDNSWSARVTWSTDHWEIQNNPFLGEDGYFGPSRLDLTIPVPAPGAALLGMIGLGVVGWVKKQFA